SMTNSPAEVTTLTCGLAAAASSGAARANISAPINGSLRNSIEGSPSGSSGAGVGRRIGRTARRSDPFGQFQRLPELGIGGAGGVQFRGLRPFAHRQPQVDVAEVFARQRVRRQRANRLGEGCSRGV